MPHAAETTTDITGFEGTLAERVLQAVRGLRYGSIELIIHDGRVVQIERREKLRIEPALSKTG